jgi:hypothetical protein
MSLHLGNLLNGRLSQYTAAQQGTMGMRQCLAIPDGTFVISIVLMAMIFTYFVIPMGLPDASLFRNGIPNDGYVIGSIIFQWMALMVALTIYYPRSQRMYKPRSGTMCTSGFQDDEFGNSMHPITTVMLTYAIVKVFSFFGAVASRNSSVETQRLVRTVLALSELIVMYLYVYNMGESAKQKYADRGRMRQQGINARGIYGNTRLNGFDNENRAREILYELSHRRGF